MDLFPQIKAEYIPWLKLWLVAFMLVFFAKAYEHYYLVLGHDHGHFLQKECQQDILNLEKSHLRILKEIPKFKDDYSELQHLLAQLDQYLNTNSEFIDEYLLVCSGDKLIYWNKDESYYDRNWCPCSADEGKGFFEEEGKIYYGLKSEVNLADTKLCITHYKRILSNVSTPENFQLTSNKVEKNQLKLTDSKGKTIGYISNAGEALSTQYSNILLCIYLIILLALYYPFHIFSKSFFNSKNYSWGILTWFVGLLMSISISQWMIHNTEFYDSFLTHSKIITVLKDYTLFEFLVLTGLIFHLAYLFNKYYLIIHFENNLANSKNKWIIPLFNYLSILLGIAIYCSSFKSVFCNSNFYFDLDRLVFMPLENYFLLFCLILLLLSIFLISHKLNLSTISFDIPFRSRIIIQVTAFVLFSFLYPYLNLDISIGTFLISSIIFILLQDFFIDYRQNNILWLISWILVISFLTSGLVFHYQNIKNRIIKSELTDSLHSFNYSSIDSTENTSSQALTNLIRLANEKNIELFIYEDAILKYSKNFKYPDYLWAKRSLGSNTKVNVQLNNNEYQLVYVKPNYIIILGHPIPSIIKAVSLFSYLFSALILLSYLLSLLNQKYKILPHSLQFQINDRPSLRNRIQFYVILSIVISFLAIAFITVFFTKKSEEEITKESINNKLKYFSSMLEQSITNITNSSDASLIIENQIKKSYSLFDYRIQYFENQGYEIPLLKNVDQSLSKIKLCDPIFYFNYSKSVQEIVSNKYLDQNAQLRIAALKNIFLNNQKIGTIKMSTSLASSTSGDSRLTNLINTLLNIYVFLFLISASLATFLANSITAPLEVLSKRLKQMRLGKKNESLEWSGQDEIGELIQDYNKMVLQLDESVELLAKTERDSAWREMAKQVAHEIKNPLTPMKLNIQYLQHQIKAGNINITELAGSVSESLLEQIDGLTKIATEFSNFAQMPKAQNERVLINDLISSVHDLFRKRDDIDILLTIPIDELFVFCDRTQLVRVLNNLINNSIQAIPDGRRGKININLSQKANRAIISIQDNGIGIPAEMHDKIFLPNFTTKTSGTGLGLAMCQQIIESLNGFISFDSEIDIGTSFFVHLQLMK
ncbi:MAG: HAMP domain-containing sensor histidine kinase [Saprospiraceae bacterium]